MFPELEKLDHSFRVVFDSADRADARPTENRNQAPQTPATQHVNVSAILSLQYPRDSFILLSLKTSPRSFAANAPASAAFLSLAAPALRMWSLYFLTSLPRKNALDI